VSDLFIILVVLLNKKHGTIGFQTHEPKRKFHARKRDILAVCMGAYWPWNRLPTKMTYQCLACQCVVMQCAVRTQHM